MEDTLDGFDEFWSVFPRKVARLDAMRMYKRALKNASAAEIYRGALRYASERKGANPKFTKHPATWLNAGCWTDEVLSEHGNPTMDAFDRLIARAEGREVEGDRPLRDVTPRGI